MLQTVSCFCGCHEMRAWAQEAESAAQATDAVRVRDVVSRCGALASDRLRSTYATKNLEQDLGRLLRSGNVEQHRDVLERPLAASALSGVHLLASPGHLKLSVSAMHASICAAISTACLCPFQCCEVFMM